MGRRLIVGDIHGQYYLLLEVLKKAGFNDEEDILYSVGDLCDRGKKPGFTVRYLMGLRDFRPVLGNHDIYLEYYLFRNIAEEEWLKRKNGGLITKTVFASTFTKEEYPALRRWFSSFPLLRLEDDAIIVHGGIPPRYTEKELESVVNARRPIPFLNSGIAYMDDVEEFLWDRSYIYSALLDAGLPAKLDENGFVNPMNTRKTIFVGHTPTDDHRPFFSEKYHLIAIDTGAGSGEGPLTLMDMDSHEYWQAGPDAIT